MRKIKRVEINDYVLVSNWSDKDIYDPYYIGFISEFGEDKKGLFYKVDGSCRYWRHAWKITEKEGRKELYTRQGK